MKLARTITRELWNHRRFTLLFIINMSLGLTGFISLDLFRYSVEHHLNERSREILGADLGLRSRQPIPESIREIPASKTQASPRQTETVTLYSMVRNGKENSRLVQLKAIGDEYPFYGALQIKGKGAAPQLQAGELWAYPEIMTQLDLQTGDAVQLGKSTFTVKGVISEDPSAGIGTSMAPRLFLRLQDLRKTGLLQQESLAWYRVLYAFPNKTARELEVLRNTVFRELEDAQIRVFTHKDASQNFGRVSRYLSDFLGLAALGSLFLAAVGTGFLFRSYIHAKTRDIAILQSLGMTPQATMRHYAAQLVLLGVFSALASCLLALGISPLLASATQDLLGMDIPLKLDPMSPVLALVLGTLGSLLICLPMLQQIRSLRPNVLLAGMDRIRIPSQPWFIRMLTILPALLSFWFIAIWQSRSILLGSLFTLLFYLSGVLFSLFVWLGLKLLRKCTRTRHISLRWALRDLTRHQFSTISAFLALALGTLLLNIIPQLGTSLKQELETPQASKLPDLFLFDIQPEQLEGVKTLTREYDANLQRALPFIRARIKKVNGEPFDKGEGRSEEALTREQEREMRFRNRGFNLSYQKGLSDSEERLKGTPLPNSYDASSDEPPALSVEHRFADRLGLKLGDVLSFEIEGVPIKGKITSLRKVRWTSFQPNFFVVFQPGVLEQAPKTFIASISQLAPKQKIRFQDALVDQFPNVSAIDITRIVERTMGLISSMLLALKIMATLTLLAGFIVLYSIANHEARNRMTDIALLKALGTRFSTIRNTFYWQFGSIAFAAAALGAASSIAVSFLLSQLLFDGLWAMNTSTPLLTFAGCVVLSLIVTHFAVQRALRIPPRQLLQR